MPLRLGLALAVFGCLSLVAADQAKDDKDTKTGRSWPHVRVGGIMVNAGYSRFSGFPYRYGYGYYPGFWGYGPYSYGWDPFMFNPYLHPGFYAGFGYQPSMGEVKVQAADKTAWVYLDGALAGRADKLKTMWLEPGAHNIEVRSGDVRRGQRIYVLSGKILKVTPEMMEARP